jgi:hypothetical protein
MTAEAMASDAHCTFDAQSTQLEPAGLAGSASPFEWRGPITCAMDGTVRNGTISDGGWFYNSVCGFGQVDGAGLQITLDGQGYWEGGRYPGYHLDVAAFAVKGYTTGSSSSGLIAGALQPHGASAPDNVCWTWFTFDGALNANLVPV